MQIPTAKHQAEIGEFNIGVKGRVKQAEGASQEEPERQLTWKDKGSQSHQPGSMQELYLDTMNIYSKCAAWFSCG